MRMMKEETYWITLAHLNGWSYQKLNNLIIQIYRDNQISIDEFFHLDESVWRNKYNLDEKQLVDLKKAKSELVGNAFLAESLLNQGYEIIPITSPEYSKTLKNNLRASHSPPVLYIKGNKKLLQEKSIAIVGSRNASKRALEFTDNIAKMVSKQHKVVVSGFAKGVDRQALDSTLKYGGKSIIVLAQGIMTFSSGYENYYKQIIKGDILILSTFYPKTNWQTKLAMARNSIIYGLANEIYIAESSEKGGTWSGAMFGLRKGWKIYVRKPEEDEKNANNLLIEKGAIPVDLFGNELDKEYSEERKKVPPVIFEHHHYENIDEKIKAVLKGSSLTAKEIISKLQLNWSTQKITIYLKTLDFVEIEKYRGRNSYKLKGEDGINPKLPLS